MSLFGSGGTLSGLFGHGRAHPKTVPDPLDPNRMTFADKVGMVGNALGAGVAAFAPDPDELRQLQEAQRQADAAMAETARYYAHIANLPQITGSVPPQPSAFFASPYYTGGQSNGGF